MQPKVGVPPPQGDGDSMEELLDAGGGVLGEDPQGDGFTEGANGRNVVLCQASQHLSHDVDEIHPCRSASRKVSCQFALDTDLQGVAWGGGSLSYGLLLEWGDDVNVQGGRTTMAPGGKEDITGLERELGIRLGISLDGARAADSAALNRTSGMALWWEILSPFPPQPTWWSPKVSAVLRHSGQE